MKDYKGHLWMKAASFAARSHRHQIRKDGETPYIAHPFRVAMVVRDRFGVDDEEILAAALLHDTIEDTNTDYDDILKAFGARVADMVSVLTKEMRMPEEQREAAYDQALKEGPWEARLVKLADVYDNISDASGSKAAAKAERKVARALALVEGDERLAMAVEQLKLHCERVKNGEGDE